MSGRRFRLLFGLEFSHDVARPLFWVLLVVLGLTSWGLAAGHVTINSGDSSVGGTKAWITSMYAVSQMLSMLVLIFYAFFVAVGAGMPVIRDEELRVGELLHATPLTPAEYVWGRFWGVFSAFLLILVLHVGFMMVFAHLLPHSGKEEILGPFHPLNYIVPMLVFATPTLFFLAAVSFSIGVFTRKPILVFMFPLAVLLVVGFFMWNWSPTWLDPRWNKLLMVLDPAGFRWINETWLKVDRGVDFYNHAPVAFDRVFLLNRLLVVGAGLLALFGAQRAFARSLRGASALPSWWPRRRARSAARRLPPEASESGGSAEPAAIPAARKPLSALQMSVKAPGLFRGTWIVLRAELRELRSQPGLYLFVPIILIQVIGTALVAVGAFETPLLQTPGGLAARALNTLTLLTVLLLLFYTVESLERERNTGFGSIFFATPLRSASMLLGKALANSAVGIVVALACLAADLVVLLVQGKVAFDLRPFLVVWGLLLVPTLVLWTAFVSTLWTLFRNRYTAYAVGLAALMASGYFQMTGKMNWVGNWDLWSAIRWSDMSWLELDRRALVLNRLFVLLLAAAFTAITVGLFTRRDRDAVGMADRLRPANLLRGAKPAFPFLAAALVAGIVLGHDVNAGFQGGAAKKLAKDYWRKNIQTYKDYPLPSVSHVDLAVNLEPARRSLAVKGAYRLVNRLDHPLDKIPLTGGLHWKDLVWTVDGDTTKPEDRSHLYVFSPKPPLAPGDSVTVGFRFHGRYPDGITKNGGGNEEFILPSGVVLTAFQPTMAPMLGFQEEFGVDKDNKSDSKDYAGDWYLGTTPSAFGVDRPFTTHIVLTGPAGYTMNSVGALTADSTSGGRRTEVWDSDRGVTFFNVVASNKWKEWKGNGTEIYYYPGHAMNLAEMGEALDAARKYYSEWFLPFPWKTLKLSEFPAMAFYAQGFPTDISFSEGIGFLTKSSPRTDLAFMVTAHESAHQWWGNILNPGKGPGGDVLSEGMAHYSTILLMQQVKGEATRMEFCKRIEERYGDRRQEDSERPLVWDDDTRAGDETVTYDKGGWVFWMLLNEMGRANDLAGVHAFITRYADNPDHPVLQDFVATMREYAPDIAAYDTFVQQWFFEKVVPEYTVTGAKRTELNAVASADSTAGESWQVTATVTNKGTGTMPVTVAAVAGKRFDADGKPDSTYADARTTVTLGAGESKPVTIRSAFKPDRVVVDPDVLVLQLERKKAVAKL